MSGRIQKKIDEYKEKNGTYPATLAPIISLLTNDSLVHEIDAFGFKWDYNPREGKVSSRGIKAKRSISAGAMVNSMIQVFRSNNNGKPPQDLIQLQQFVWKHFTERTANLTDPLGPDMNVILSPFGTPWDYDALLGKVNIPPICAMDVLFRNADKILNSQQ
jgi:hypothetical protein